MALFDLQSLEWTPAAYFLAFHAFLILVSSVPFLLGCTDGLYKLEPHTKEISSRPFELFIGGCFFGWSLALVGALIHGAAQIMCIVQLIPMSTATYYHYLGNGTTSVVINIVVGSLLAFFGFVPLPEVEPIVWTPPAICMAVIGSSVALTGISLLASKTDSIYAYEPHTKKWMTREGELFHTADSLYADEPHTKQWMTRQGELFLGSCFLGWGLAIWVAVVARGAQDMAILLVIGIQPCSYYHYSQGGTKNVIVNTVLSMIALYFGVMY